MNKNGGIKPYLEAGYPILAARTAEPLRFMLRAYQGARSAERAVYQWDGRRGYSQITEEKPQWTEADPWDVLEEAATTPDSLWLLNNYDFFLSQPETIQTLQNYAPVYKAQGTTLCIVGATLNPPPHLDIKTLYFPLPNRAELAELLDGLTQKENIGLDPERRAALIDALTGLTWIQAENALAFSLVRDGELLAETVSELKIQMIENIPGLKFQKFSETFDNMKGGEKAKSWIINRFTRRALNKKLPFKGALFLGPPGTGKSHLVKGSGAAVKLKVITFDLSRVFGSLVGQTEAQLDLALDTLDALAPIIVMIDEIDKAVGGGGGGGGGGDGGTTQRALGKFLTWLQDHESECYCFATCNDWEALSSFSQGAFVRAGRWDATFFVDLPNHEERDQILDLYLRQYCDTPLDAYPQKPNLEGYSGAEIKQVAIETAYNGGNLQEAIKFVIPLSKTNKADIDKLRQWAVGRTIPATDPLADAAVNVFDFARAVKWEK